MVSSAGIIITNGKKLLGVFPASKDNWDIPKGKKKNSKESDINCAIRECEEETGIILSKSDLIDIGIFPYTSQNLIGKKLHLYIYKTSDLPEISEMKCNSYKMIGGQKFSEIIKYKYIKKKKIGKKFLGYLVLIIKEAMWRTK